MARWLLLRDRKSQMLEREGGGVIVPKNKSYLIRAENFRIMDIEINAWSSLFANLKTNLVFRFISRDYEMRSLTFEQPVFNFPVFVVSYQLD